MAGQRRQAQAWQTFHVAVRRERGAAQVRAQVWVSAVYGAGTPRPYDTRPIFDGVVATWDGESPLSVEEAAELAASALRRAFPGLF